MGIAHRTEALVGFYVRQLVRDVGEPGSAWFEAVDEFEGLVNGLVHGMRRVAQSVKDNIVKIFEEWERRFGDGAEVG